MRTLRIAALAAMAAAPLLAGGGSTQNLIADLGNFDTGSEPASWQVVSSSFSDMQWDMEDAAGCAGSGSGEITNSEETVDFASAQFRLCVESGVVPDVNYRFGIWTRFVAESVGSSVDLLVRFYEGAGCTGNVVGPAGTAFLTNAVTGWQQVGSEAVAAGSAASIDFRVRLRKFDADDPDAVALIDRVLLATDDYVFGDGFESGDICRWTTVVP